MLLIESEKTVNEQIGIAKSAVLGRSLNNDI